MRMIEDPSTTKVYVWGRSNIINLKTNKAEKVTL